MNIINKYWWIFLLICFIAVGIAIYLHNKKVLQKVEVQYQEAQNGRFAPIVTPLSIRSDSQGDGHYGSRRSGGARKHNGVDLLISEGQSVFAPFDGVIERVAYPYASDKRWKGFLLASDDIGLKIKVFYVTLVVAVGQRVKKGERIAVAQAISKKYSASMKDHIHVEVHLNNIATDPIDPTDWVFGKKQV